jgi:DNA-binding protein HU-beta
MLKRQITKDELYSHLAQCASVSQSAASAIVEELARVAAKETEINGAFLLPGIGMIEIIERPERTGVNPMTGEKIRIRAKSSLKFTFESRFKNAVSAA